ncbi:hypothetical protein HDU97_004308 [Phlyctochytrium planicorne]|nr:hypothetical protein HDU97_004308 [Phlyctochytrium planicorne]
MGDEILNIELSQALEQLTASPSPSNMTLETIHLGGEVDTQQKRKAYVLRNVLTPLECQTLISFAESQHRESGEPLCQLKLSDDGRNNQYVSTHRCVLRSPGFAELMWKRVSPILEKYDEQVRDDFVLTCEGDNEDPYMVGKTWKMHGTWRVKGLNEVWRLARYDTDGHFGPHRDGVLQLGLNLRSMKTFMFYLNGDFEGGGTHFVQDQGLFRDETGKIRAQDGTIISKIQPEQGMAIIFNHNLLHEGGTLLSGKKYILRAEIMYTRISPLETTPEQEEGIRLKREAELMESSGRLSEAVTLYRKAFRLCPELERV